MPVVVLAELELVVLAAVVPVGFPQMVQVLLELSILVVEAAVEQELGLAVLVVQVS